MSSGMKERLCRSLEKVLHAETRELPAAVGGILLFFLLFLAYSMLRPVRETMGIAGGVQSLQWLFTATFAASIGVQFLFGWVSSKVRRKAILPWTYGFFILNLAVFAALVLACPGNIWTARSFYVWLSVFNLLTVSVAWSVLSDVMKPGQMKRLFALIASGSSLGAMTGPAVTAALAGVAGLLWLFLAAAVLLALAMLAGMYLHRWCDGNSPEDAETGVRLPADCRERPLGGNPFAGASAVFRSPFLMGIGLFIRRQPRHGRGPIPCCMRCTGRSSRRRDPLRPQEKERVRGTPLHLCTRAHSLWRPAGGQAYPHLKAAWPQGRFALRSCRFRFSEACTCWNTVELIA